MLFIANIASLTLINNAAQVSPIKMIDECTPNEIAAHVQLNLTAPVLLTSSFLANTSDWKVKRRIVNISSGSALYPAHSMSLYCSTKSALNMFTQCVGLEQNHILNAAQIIAVNPGMMDTDMQTTARNSQFELASFFSEQKT
ncbi:SDR family NAD(P)-dependent oxidoreductase [Paenibacillus ferrarius]|uniref:SDR family NAD(P)-dependent oxidoreductase n=1 Tax=Paenibacillus ferrarius TaxID=1469647 RepID=UPI003D2D6CDF